MNNKNKNGWISEYIFLVIFVLLASGIITAGYFYYRHYEKKFRGELENQLSSTAELKIGQLELWRKERLNDAETFLNNRTFSSMVSSFYKQPDNVHIREELNEWLSKFQLSYQYERISLIDTNEVERLTVPWNKKPAAAATKKKSLETLQTGQIKFQDFYRSEIDQKIYLAVFIPLFDKRDKGIPLGSLILRIDPSAYLYPFIQKWPTPNKSAETLIVRRDGNDALFLNDIKFQKTQR